MMNKKKKVLFKIIIDLLIIVLLNTIVLATSKKEYNIGKIMIKNNESKINNLLTKSNKIKVGDVVKRGKLNYGIEGKNYNDDIEWIVLDVQGSNVLLFSKYIINFMPFSLDGNINWCDSDVREYLNDSFINGIVTFLNPTEKKYIDMTTKNTNIKTYNVASHSEILTNDKVFLLSNEEIKRYFECINNKYMCASGEIIDYVNDALFENEYENYNNDNKYNFLLRDSNINSNGILLINKDGELIEDGILPNTPCGIRPAMWINDSTLIADNTIHFGKYEQNNNIQDGKETIEWIPLELNDNKLLIISKYILDFGVYSISKEKMSYENSEIRKFLNGKFMQDSFDTNEKHYIASSEIISYNGSYRDKEKPVKTMDYIFIPGFNEYDKYSTFKNFTNKLFKTTSTNYANSIIKDKEYDSFYWLRDFYSKYHSAIYVKSYGNIEWDLDKLNSEKLGIRPMLWLDITKEDISNVINNISSKKEEGPISEILMKKPINVDLKKKQFVLGKYEQDGNIENGKEDLDWLILGKYDEEKDSNEYICITKYIIDVSMFSDERGKEYKDSLIRNMLYEKVYKESFNEYEKTLLTDIHIDSDNGNDIDKVSILSFDLCIKYCDIEYNYRYGDLDYISTAAATSYAKEQYKQLTGNQMYENKEGNSSYYLRDMDDASYGILHVNASGSFRNTEREYIYYGVRPIIKVNLDIDYAEQ